MIQPHEPLFKGMIFFIDGIGFVELQYVLPKDKVQVETVFNKKVLTCPLPELNAVSLTEKILTEWCGWKQDDWGINSPNFNDWSYLFFKNGYLELSVSKHGFPLKCNTLHHLQRLILALTNQPLKIELK